MKITFGDRIERGDALSRVRTGPGMAERYSEWHHFTFDDAAAGVHGICNLGVSGDVRDPERARAEVSLAVRADGRWHGTMNVHPMESVRSEAGAVDLAVGGSSVRFDGGRYEVRAALGDGAVAVDAAWEPASEGVRVEGIGGLVSTFVVPRLVVTGTVTAGGRQHRLDGATGYHDHNWGYWTWGADLGWDWGYVVEPPSGGAGGDPAGGAGGPPLTLVFGRVTDAARARPRSELVLLVWEGERLGRVFLDEAVDLAVEGELPRDAVPRVPGVVALLDGRRRPAPARVQVRAEEGDDHLDAVLDVAAALQFLVPSAAGATTTVSELVGRYDVRGVLDGGKVAFSSTGFAELAG